MFTFWSTFKLLGEFRLRDESCLSPTDLTTAFYISSHLCSRYMFSTDFSLETTGKQALFSLELVASSEMTHPPLSASHPVFAK